jgi:1-phosphatidylinositol-3-phosphate 5-kinase
VSLNPPTEDKPLPDEPLSKLIHALSNDHKKHFVDIITSCVESEDLPGSWAKSIEYAVNQMAMAISYEDWLIGLKRAHARRIQVEEKRVQTRRDEWKRERDRDRDKEKEKPKAKKAEVKHEPKKPEREFSEAYSFATETVVKALADLRNRIKNRSPTATQDKTTPCHLLLSLRVTTPQSHHQSSIFSSFDSRITRFDANLNFQSSYFSLPDNLADEEDVTVLFGLNEWKEDVVSEMDPRLVGGSFLIKSTTPRIYHAVANCLRVAIYCRLAMILEQFLFHDLGYKLQFPSPASISKAQGSSFRRVSSLRGRAELASKSPPIPPVKLDSSSSLRRQLWLFVADKAEKIDKFLTRNSLVGQTPDTDSGSEYFPRSASLDLPFTTRGSNEFDKREIISRDRTPVPEAVRTSSGESSTGYQTTKERDGLPPFTHILSRLGDSLPLLSTSPAVLFETPRLLKNLSEREETDRNRRLRGDERIALDTILGWEGRETRGRGMTGITGFVRHQQITVLFTATVPAPPIPVEKGQKNAIPITGRVSCRKAQRTFRYFSDDAKEDITLGGLVETLCGSANERCDIRLECDHSVGQHEFEWIHAGVRLRAKLSPHPFAEDIVMWQGCAVCDKTSSKVNMSEATW